MKARSYNSGFERLENRCLMSGTDFNGDSLEDKVELTNSTTITVSLNNGDGTFTVSAILTAPKNRPIGQIFVGDYNDDGKLDISGGGGNNGNKKLNLYSSVWLGNGDGTFDNRKTNQQHPDNHGGF